MPIATVFYFSGTGNTRFCAMALGEALAEGGFDARVASIEGLGRSEVGELVAGSGILCFAYPVYGSDLPDPMAAFMRGLPPVPGGATRDCAVLCTQWLFSGDGAAVADEFLAVSGRTARWTAHVPMPNDICISAVRVPYTNDPEKLKRSRDRASGLVRAFAGAIVSGKPASDGRGFLSRPLGLLQRAPFRKYGSSFRDAVASVDGLCTGCGLCARLCPVGNLELRGMGVLGRGSCVLCMRCYDFCPASAISFLGKPHDPRRGKPYRGPEPGFDPATLRKELAVFKAVPAHEGMDDGAREL